jgi:hypothetical protein
MISIKFHDLANISDIANISAGLNSHATTDKHEPAHFGNMLESTNTFAWRIE